MRWSCTCASSAAVSADSAAAILLCARQPQRASHHLCVTAVVALVFGASPQKFPTIHPTTEFIWNFLEFMIGQTFERGQSLRNKFRDQASQLFWLFAFADHTCNCVHLCSWAGVTLDSRLDWHAPEYNDGSHEAQTRLEHVIANLTYALTA